jgi:hypothetical protein
VENVDDIHRALQRWPIEGALTLKVIRDRSMVEVEVTPAESP